MTTSSAGHVLVIDDSPDNRKLLARSLERRGYSVCGAGNGRLGLEMLRAQPFHLVLLDIMMPEMSGYEVLRDIRADSSLCRIPVVIISGVDELDGLVTSLELGADDYLAKPFNAATLNARIEACLERKRERDLKEEQIGRIEKAKRRSDELLRVILPDTIAEELKATNAVRSRHCEDVAVLFADVVDFASYCDIHEPAEVVERLQGMVSAFELLTDNFGLQKIKTIGDCFMATAGLLEPAENPVENCVRCGLEMIRTARDLPPGWDLRVGIDCGDVVAGVTGARQYLFDVWGGAVNTAARVEKYGQVGAVNLSRNAWARISDWFEGESVGVVEVKGATKLEIFRVNATEL